MKRFIYIGVLSIPVLLASCSSSRYASKREEAGNSSPRFLNKISIKSGKSFSKSNGAHKYTEQPEVVSGDNSTASGNTNASELQYKYASLLNVSPSEVSDISLLTLIDDWYGTPYAMGGNSKDGIDCSGFSKMLLGNIYNEDIPRTSEEQYEACKHIKKEKLKEGDLVFFHTYRGSYITHVGVYLQNNKFVHASSHGVMISDLNEDYWRKTYRASGRVKNDEAVQNDDE